jgi:O-antigen ligase
MLSGDLLTRLGTFSADEGDEGAIESQNMRKYLLRKSIEYTFQHPLFGVGPGQFANYEGTARVAAGGQGMWFNTHNTLTQVSSECGIPALLFFLAAIVSTFRLLNQTWRKAQQAGMVEVVSALLYIRAAFVAFFVAAFFLNQGYMFYFPAFTGIVIAISSALQHDRQAAAPAFAHGPATNSIRNRLAAISQLRQRVINRR